MQTKGESEMSIDTIPLVLPVLPCFPTSETRKKTFKRWIKEKNVKGHAGKTHQKLNTEFKKILWNLVDLF